MTKKKWIFLGVVGLLMAGYLVYSNKLVIGVGSALLEMKTVQNASGDYESNTEGFAEITNFRQRNDILRTFEITGYAAIPTDAENEGKTAKLVLRGKEHSYEVEGYFGWSNNLNNHFSTTGIRGGYHKFKAEFSSILIEDGLYNVFIYDRENDKNYGLLNAYTILEKKDDSLQEYIFPEVEQIESVESRNISTSLTSRLDSVENNYYNVSGLAVKTGCNSDDSKMYLEFMLEDGSTHTFPAMLRPHSWYNSLMDSDLYTLSKFTVKVPVDLLNGKTVMVKVIIENDGVYHHQEETAYEFTSTGYRRVFTSALQEMPGQITEDYSVNATVWNGLAKKLTDYYLINGFAFVRELPIEQPEIYVMFQYEDGTYSVYPAEVQRNDWIAEHVGEEFAQSGCQVKIYSEDLRPETVNLYVLVGDGEVFCRTKEPITYIWQDGQFIQQQGE